MCRSDEKPRKRKREYKSAPPTTTYRAALSDGKVRARDFPPSRFFFLDSARQRNPTPPFFLEFSSWPRFFSALFFQRLPRSEPRCRWHFHALSSVSWPSSCSGSEKRAFRMPASEGGFLLSTPPQSPPTPPRDARAPKEKETRHTRLRTRGRARASGNAYRVRGTAGPSGPYGNRHRRAPRLRLYGSRRPVCGHGYRAAAVRPGRGGEKSARRRYFAEMIGCG